MKKKSSMDEIVCGVVYPEKYSEVIQLLRCSFFADEPLNKSVGLCERGQTHEELEEFSLNILSQGLSIMGELKSTGEVVGVLLNGVEKAEAPSMFNRKIFKDHRLQKIFDFLGSVDKDVEYLTHYNVNSILELKILSVSQTCRGRGIAKILYNSVENFAQSKGFALLRTDATSLFSQKLFEKEGFKTLKEIAYDEYPSKDAPVFKVAPPHVSFKLMVKKLQSN